MNHRAHVLLLLLTASLTFAEGEAFAQTGPSEAQDPSTLLDAAIAAYDQRDYAQALAFSQQVVALVPGVDSALAYQILIPSAEQLGDLPAMRAGIDAYRAALTDPKDNRLAKVNAAALRLEFYTAERGGDLRAAREALAKANAAKPAPDAAWSKMASTRLKQREQLNNGSYGALVTLTPSTKDSPGQVAWLTSVRAEAIGRSSLATCEHEQGIAALDAALALTVLTPEERRRAEALKVRLLAERAMLDPSNGDVVSLASGLAPLGGLTSEEQAWLARATLRGEQDARWRAGAYAQTFEMREHYRTLTTQNPVEPSCLAPEWLTLTPEREQELLAVEQERLRQEALAREAEEQRKRDEERDDAKGRALGKKLLISGGASGVLAGASALVMVQQTNAYYDVTPQYSRGELSLDAANTAIERHQQWASGAQVGLVGLATTSVLLIGAGVGVGFVW